MRETCNVSNESDTDGADIDHALMKLNESHSNEK